MNYMNSKSKKAVWKFFFLVLLNAFIGTIKGKISNSTLTVRNCGTSLGNSDSLDRIVGGKDAKPGQFPWMVSLRELDDFGFDHICGAAILNENWVITAAHCFDYESPKRYEILAGLHRLSKERDSRVRLYKISKIIIHEEFDEDTYENDIALLKTTKPIDISGSKGYINGICLPDTKADPTGWATVAGWGHTREDGMNSDYLKHVLVPIIERGLCNTAYDIDVDDDYEEIKESMICAGTGGKDSCQNDSGGPLIQTTGNGVSTLIGIVSHGAGCGLKFYPGVYTKISMYQNWLKKSMV